MGYLPPATIAETLQRIQKGELILPAIQREYVWKPKQVVALFDSIMRGYPIGGFLSWKVDPEITEKFRFYGFIKDYSEFDNRHNPTLDLAPTTVTAILDGQQRLTSLNVGLRGSYAYKRARAWSNLAENYPTRRLYLNVLGEAAENEAGLRYDFRFLTDADFKSAAPEEGAHWFPVTKVFATDDLGDLWDLAADAGLANDKTARNTLSHLWKAVHTAPSVYFYEETEQDVERVLDIFIRVNSAGTVLSYSDLLLSIATAQWKERDAREAIHGLVDALNSAGQGFRFSQDVVLKSGLVLAGVGDIGFKVKNFTAENMATLDQQWDAISGSLKVAAGLLSDFGLSDATLSADSVLIPVAYYVHRRGLTHSYRSSVHDASDRSALRSWVLRSLIVPGVWGSGLDSLLRDLRQTIATHGDASFPAAELEKRMAARGKSVTITDELLEDILSLRYGAARTYAVLASVFPHVDTRNVFHLDHVFPQAMLTTPSLKKAGIDPAAIADLQERTHELPNLQLMEGPVNIAKSDKPPAAWAQITFATDAEKQNFLDRNAIPWLPASADEFLAFFEDRRDALKHRIRTVLGVPSGGAETAESAPSALNASIEDQLADADYAE